MSELREPRSSSAAPEYYFRRRLAARELLPAIGVGIAAGFVAFYVAGLFAQRTPLRTERRLPSPRPLPSIARSPEA